MSKEQREGVSRRTVLCGIACGCAVVAATTSGCTIAEVYTNAGSGELSFDLAEATYAPLSDLGGAVAVDIVTDADPVKALLIRNGEAQVIALERICPHTLCDMTPGLLGAWDQAAQQLTCLCHTSIFDVDGNLLAGPSPRGIARYPVDFDAGSGTGRVQVGASS